MPLFIGWQPWECQRPAIWPYNFTASTLTFVLCLFTHSVGCSEVLPSEGYGDLHTVDPLVTQPFNSGGLGWVLE